MLILVADDMLMTRDKVKDILREVYPSAELIEATTGEEIQELIREGKRPDLIVSDQNFEDFEGPLKGTDVIRWLREEMAIFTPVVMFTSDWSAARRLKKEWQVEVTSSLNSLRSVLKSLAE